MTTITTSPCHGPFSRYTYEDSTPTTSICSCGDELPHPIKPNGPEHLITGGESSRCLRELPPAPDHWHYALFAVQRVDPCAPRYSVSRYWFRRRFDGPWLRVLPLQRIGAAS